MFFLMGLVDGNDLQTWMDDERLYVGTMEQQQRRLVAITHQLVCAVHHLHKRGILHQDIKPENVLMTKIGKPVLGDFGVASNGSVNESMLEGVLRGATRIYASPRVRQLFFQVTALPAHQREALLTKHKITHLDDFWTMAATIFDMFAYCGWRGGRSVAEMLRTKSDLHNLANKSKLCVTLPTGMLKVLENCLSFQPASNVLTIDSAADLMSTVFSSMCSPPCTQDGLSGKRCANIRNNLGIALHDNKQFSSAHKQFNQAINVDTTDSRSWNNMGVVHQTQDAIPAAKGCYEKALEFNPTHREAIVNLGILRQSGGRDKPQFDRKGAEGTFVCTSSLVDLRRALNFVTSQSVRLRCDQGWRICTVVAGDGHGGASLVEFQDGSTMRLQAPLVQSGYQLTLPGPQSSLADNDGLCWKCGTCTTEVWNRFDTERTRALVEQERQQDGRGDRGASTSRHEPQQIHGVVFVRVRWYYEAEKEWGAAVDELSETPSTKDLPPTPITVRWDNDNETTVGVHFGRIQLVSSVQYAPKQRLFVFHDAVWHQASVDAVVDVSSRGHSQHRLQLETGDCVTIDLNDANHAPAMFNNLQSLEREFHPYQLELKSEHGTIYDIFSAEELSTLTQTATLKYCETVQRAKLLATDVDTDGPGYQESQKSAPNTAGTNVTELLREIMSVRNDRRMGYMPRHLLLILGPAASGKTTLIKTFIMVILRDYAGYVPILISVISLVRMLDKRTAGESVIAAFLRTQYPQHLNMLTQAMFQRRVIFFVDGIDESGARRNEVQAVVDEELLAPEHSTIITSRHGGFSSAAFQQCRMLELLPLGPSQQSEMVHLRVLDVEKADQLVGELKNKVFHEIASNPLMLTMLISLYVRNGCQVIVNRSKLYEQALRSMADQIHSGGNLDEKLFQCLQNLAFKSHWRDGERRIFLEHEAAEWTGDAGWAAIKEAVKLRKLPIIVSMGPDESDTHQYRFGHLSYQEFLAGREVHQRLVSVQPQALVGTMTAIFGEHPAMAFTNVQHQLMLKFLADLLLASELLSQCSEAIFGVNLKLSEKLGHAGAEALAPYLKANTTLRFLDVSSTELGKYGMCVLADAMANTNIAYLDISHNEIVVGSGEKLDGVAALCQMAETSRLEWVRHKCAGRLMCVCVQGADIVECRE
jgi:serine/threonine protein kinase